MTTLRSKLLGAWQLTGYIAELGSDDVIHPLGPDASGFIMYTPDGYMSACVMRADRPKFQSTDAMGGEANELAAAAAGYLAYAGTYDVDEKQAIVTHHLQAALVPNWVGTDLRRKIILSDDALELRGLAPSLVGGQMRLVRVLWKRAAH